MTRAFSVLALALFAGSGGGCGPVQYMAQVGGPTQAALAQAEREGAESGAPYEYTAAVEYLKKARDEASRSQFQTAIEYGKSAEEYANKARALSRERKAAGKRPAPARADSPTPGEPPGDAPGVPARGAGAAGANRATDAEVPKALRRRAPARERGSR